MRTALTWVMSFALYGAMLSTGLAQDANTDKQPAAPQPAAKPDPATSAKLRAEIHRTMAALIEAQAAEKPDAAKVKELTDQLQKLRAQRWAESPAPPAMGRGGAWGGPRMGPGPGRGGPGKGFGPGYGRGPGFGPGPAAGRGPGYGAGPGWGRGPGYGRGAGWGAGSGWGRAFVDLDGNGICDNYERPLGK